MLISYPDRWSFNVLCNGMRNVWEVRYKGHMGIWLFKDLLDFCGNETILIVADKYSLKLTNNLYWILVSNVSLSFNFWFYLEITSLCLCLHYSVWIICTRISSRPYHCTQLVSISGSFGRDKRGGKAKYWLVSYSFMGEHGSHRCLWIPFLFLLRELFS